MTKNETARPDLGNLVSKLAWVNIELWHEEDKARSPDDSQVARAKRRIDALNQKRNDLIEALDELASRRPSRGSRGAGRRGASRGWSSAERKPHGNHR